MKFALLVVLVINVYKSFENTVSNVVSSYKVDHYRQTKKAFNMWN